MPFVQQLVQPLLLGPPPLERWLSPLLRPAGEAEGAARAAGIGDATVCAQIRGRMTEETGAPLNASQEVVAALGLVAVGAALTLLLPGATARSALWQRPALLPLYGLLGELDVGAAAADPYGPNLLLEPTAYAPPLLLLRLPSGRRLASGLLLLLPHLRLLELRLCLRYHAC